MRAAFWPKAMCLDGIDRFQTQISDTGMKFLGNNEIMAFIPGNECAMPRCLTPEKHALGSGGPAGRREDAASTKALGSGKTSIVCRPEEAE
jgi:hypothetical protein